jgi:hypothetical protein
MGHSRNLPSAQHEVKSRPQGTGVMIGRMISAFGADDVVDVPGESSGNYVFR